MRILAIDFDGTITRHSRYPQIGEPNTELIEWLKREKEGGVKLILWTCRVGDLLNQAVKFCEKQGLYFDAVNENLLRSLRNSVETPERFLPINTLTMRLLYHGRLLSLNRNQRLNQRFYEGKQGS